MAMVSKFCKVKDFNKLLTQNIFMDLTDREEIPRWSLPKELLGCCKRSPEIKRHNILVKKGL